MGVLVLPAREDEGNVDRYLLSKRLAVERRTGSSFLRGIMDKTLFTSAIHLSEHYSAPVLIVEGQVDYTYSHFDPQAVRGALTSMVLEYGLSVLATEDAEETVSLIGMMARQEQVGIPEISFAPKRKATGLADLQRRVVEMLPGCGMVMAREMLQRMGSVRRIANATTEDLREIRGIGSSRASEIHRVFEAEYDSIDTERDLEDAVEAEPGLLFDIPMVLVARQHVLFEDDNHRHVVDLVFGDASEKEVVFVELKRGGLAPAHEDQLARYLDLAWHSSVVGPRLDAGARLRGVLATVEACEYQPRREDIDVHFVDRRRALEVLRGLRRRSPAGACTAEAVEPPGSKKEACDGRSRN